MKNNPVTLARNGKRWREGNTEHVLSEQRKWHALHPEKHAQYAKAHRAKIRADIIDHYGGRCSCCGETNRKFLTIHHSNGDGAAHRRLLSSNGRSADSVKVFSWIKNHGYPASFQVLCYNCNCGTQFNGGVCPHLEVKNGE